MKSIVLVSEPGHINTLKKIQEDSIIVATSKDLQDTLIKSGIRSQAPHLRDYSDVFFIKWVKMLPKHIQKNGVDMLTGLSHDKLSYWWLMEKWILGGDGHFNSISDVLNAVEVVDNIIKKYNPKKIIYVDDDKLYSKVISYICEIKGIHTDVIEDWNSHIFSIKKGFSDILIKWFLIGSFYIRKFNSRYLKHKGSRKNDVIFMRGIPWERVYDYNSGHYTLREPFTDTLKENFKKSLSVGYQIGTEFGINRPDYENYKVLENYYDSKAGIEYKKIISDIRKSFRGLIKNSNFKKSFVFLNYNIWPLVKTQFKRYFDIRLSGHARTHSMILRMIEREKPKVVIAPEEVSDTTRILFSVCIKNSIPCVAVQHGIFDNNILCYHNKGEVSLDKISPNLCPIPAKTCVYGQHYKDILVKNGHYPSDSVIVTGSQRFDRIFNQKFSKKSFYKRYSISPNKKIISYITSPTPHNESMTIALLNEAKKVKNSIIAIKIHPSESKDFYYNIIKNVGSDAIVLDRSDLYDVLNASDVVITFLSTAGMEAMLFNKPLVVLNLTGTKDIMNYASSGAAVGIYKKDDISTKLNELLSRKKLYKRIQTNSRKFIKKNAFNSDGKASWRVTNIIRSFLNSYKDY